MPRLVRLALLFTVVSLGFGLANPASAQQRVVPPQGGVKWSYAPVVQKVAPAVVNVYASRTEKLARNPLFDDPFFQQFFGRDLAGQSRERVEKSLGSGVMVDPSGLVVTN